MRAVISPPATIGILGGGQLGRMIALKAREMGYGIITLDPTPDSPCGQVADEQVQAAFDSMDGAIEIAKRATVLTYEFENIGTNIAQHLEKESFLPQGFSLLFTTQNRLREKEAIVNAGVQVAPYRAIESKHDLEDAITHIGYPAVLKTAEGGYDGKGQWVIKNERQLLEVLEAVFTDEPEAGAQGVLEQGVLEQGVLEQWVPFVKEISCIVARNEAGEMETFPIAENIHHDNILHMSIVPARVPEDVQHKAAQLARQLAEAFQLVGLLAIEMFVLEDGTLYVNELAPRPHNSGHYTMEACHTSQFEQHVRAICNLPLTSTELFTPVVMVNILGEHVDAVLKWMSGASQQPCVQEDLTVKVHLYGKKEIKSKRKMGHINILAAHTDLALDWIAQTNIWNGGS